MVRKKVVSGESYTIPPELLKARFERRKKPWGPNDTIALYKGNPEIKGFSECRNEEDPAEGSSCQREERKELVKKWRVILSR